MFEIQLHIFYVVPYLKNLIVFTEAAFDALLSKYNKTYENEKEKDKRLKIYIRNTKKIDENNELYKNNFKQELLRITLLIGRVDIISCFKTNPVMESAS